MSTAALSAALFAHLVAVAFAKFGLGHSMQNIDSAESRSAPAAAALSGGVSAALIDRLVTVALAKSGVHEFPNIRV